MTSFRKSLNEFLKSGITFYFPDISLFNKTTVSCCEAEWRPNSRIKKYRQNLRNKRHIRHQNHQREIQN
jgi:hypothetical protein